MEFKELHEIIKKLKEYMYRAEDVDSLRDLDLLISEVKCEIYSNEFLRKEYEKRVNSFKESLPSREEKNEIIFARIKDFVNGFYPLQIKENIIAPTVDFLFGFGSPYLYYFPVLKFVMGKKTFLKKSKYKCYPDISNVQQYYGLYDFYIFNILKFLNSQEELSVLEQTTKINKIKNFIIDNIDDESCENANFYALEFENYVVMERDLLPKDKFFMLWMASALLKVLEVLQTELKMQMHTDSNIEKEIKRMGLQNNIKTPLTAEEIEILHLRKTLEDHSFEKIAEKMAEKFKILIDKNGIKRCSHEIRNKIGGNDIDQAVLIFEDKYYKL